MILLAAGRLARAGRAWRRRRLLVVNQDGRRLLAWADLTAQRLDLRGGRPAVVAVALRGLGDTQMQRVHAPVRVPAHEVFREPARAGLPRLLPRRHALLDLRFDGRDKRGVVVLQGPRGGLANCLRHQAISSRLSHSTAYQCLLQEAGKPRGDGEDDARLSLGRVHDARATVVVWRERCPTCHERQRGQRYAASHPSLGRSSSRRMSARMAASAFPWDACRRLRPQRSCRRRELASFCSPAWPSVSI